MVLRSLLFAVPVTRPARRRLWHCLYAAACWWISCTLVVNPFVSPQRTPALCPVSPLDQQLFLASPGLCHRLASRLPALSRFESPVARRAMAISRDTLALQNSVTSAAIIEAFKDDAGFKKVAERLMTEIMRRDQEDGDKLAKGIQLAIDKKVLPADVKVEPTTKISVSGKTADKVADEIIAALGDGPSKGCVMTLQGLSGTGKGTTVDKLKEKLPNAQTWSNGNLFRSLTLLAVTCAEQKGCELKDVLTSQDLDAFCKMLEFGKFNGKWDVKIDGLGCQYFVSDVEKTVLKESKVAKNIPTVAEVTQGEVVNFVQGALAQMAAGGTNVLLEGREQTLNHIRTPNRFELVLDDPVIIGMRQAALQMGAKAYEKVKDAPDASEATVKSALQDALASMA